MIRELSKSLSKSILLILVFFIVYLGKRFIAPSDIVFYEGLFISIGVAGTAFLTIIGIHLYFKRLKLRDWINAVIIQALFGYAVIITFPSLLDRSISMYILATIAKSGKQVPVERIQKLFEVGYVRDTYTVNKRLNEQIATGNILIKDETIFITERGMKTFSLHKSLASLFNISKKFVDPNIKEINQEIEKQGK